MKKPSTSSCKCVYIIRCAAQGTLYLRGWIGFQASKQSMPTLISAWLGDEEEMFQTFYILSGKVNDYKIFFYPKVPTLFGMVIMICQLVIMDRRRYCIMERASCHALLHSLLQLLGLHLESQS